MISSRPKLVVSGTFTAEPVREVLDFWVRHFSWELDTTFASYNQVFQNLLDPGSPLGMNRDGVNVLLIRWDDLLSRNSGAELDRVADDLADALRAAAARGRAPYVVVFSRAGGSGNLNSDLLGRLSKVECDLRDQVADLAGIHLVESQWIQRLYPVENWRDADGERTGHVPYTPEYFAAMGTAIARKIDAIRRKPYKVVVLDCDNTLWGGVCGEDGAAGVRIDEPFRILQEFMVAQAAAGRVLCLCSKNREEDVREVFNTRSEMPLAWKDIVAHRINWDAKAANIQALAEELDLGLDSFIFLDDNPIECASVSAALPEVLTIRIPTNVDEIPRVLDHVWAFDTLRVTEEDRRRGDMYREGALRNQARREAPSLEDFLTALDLRIDIAPVGPADLARASQLTQRTNQFNATGIVRSEQEIASLLDRDGHFAKRVTVSDRFGDYGTVGLVAGTSVEGALRVDTFLLSCRALGRGVEHAMVADLGREALERGLDTVHVAFRGTEKNEPALRFIHDLGALEHARISGTGVDLPAAGASKLSVEDLRRSDDDTEASNRDTLASSRRSAIAPGILSSIPFEFSRASDVWAAIRAQVRGRPELQQAYVEPRRGVEQSLAEIWKDVLRVDRVGVLDRFSDLGGSSLQLVRIHGRLRTELGTAVELTSLMQHATIRSLADHIETLGEGTDADRATATRARAERQRAAFAAAGLRRTRRNDSSAEGTDD